MPAGVFRRRVPSASPLGRLSRSFITGKSTDSRRKLPSSSVPRNGGGVRWRAQRRSRAAALAETVKADMFTCECDSCVTCSGVQRASSEQSSLRNLLRLGRRRWKRAEFVV